MHIIRKLHRQFMHFMKIHEKFIHFTTACCKISAQYQPLANPGKSEKRPCKFSHILKISPKQSSNTLFKNLIKISRKTLNLSYNLHFFLKSTWNSFKLMHSILHWDCAIFQVLRNNCGIWNGKWKHNKEFYLTFLYTIFSPFSTFWETFHFQKSKSIHINHNLTCM
jgi:hypothetical protein